ncbi:rhodanese-like domain-containing protein [Phaeobacter sp. HF9A]|uniref:rhodanese-like domain-containing protein n=1 Tax=Phaeobacter sp. HF9A TaxID=2721561 RepID=UPI001431680D|nr:rhodanese-like domain-containing protein [Phaeobacter sp. HF9A]NIZ14737.1 rhodanese-like domain-containing protein [Phaeobacter sp. HF9A]
MTIVPKKRFQEIVMEAERQISFVSIDEALALNETKAQKVEFVDVRVYRELEKTGVIPGAVSCPRGLLEFWIDQDSPYGHAIFASDAKFIFYCDNGWRSTLATLLAMEMGVQDVHCLRGGLDGWSTANGPMIPYKW